MMERCAASHRTLPARCEYPEDGHWRHRSHWRGVMLEWGSRPVPPDPEQDTLL